MPVAAPVPAAPPSAEYKPAIEVALPLTVFDFWRLFLSSESHLLLDHYAASTKNLVWSGCAALVRAVWGGAGGSGCGIAHAPACMPCLAGTLLQLQTHATEGCCCVVRAGGSLARRGSCNVH